MASHREIPMDSKRVVLLLAALLPALFLLLPPTRADEEYVPAFDVTEGDVESTDPYSIVAALAPPPLFLDPAAARGNFASGGESLRLPVSEQHRRLRDRISRLLKTGQHQAAVAHLISVLRDPDTSVSLIALDDQGTELIGAQSVFTAIAQSLTGAARQHYQRISEQDASTAMARAADEPGLWLADVIRDFPATQVSQQALMAGALINLDRHRNDHARIQLQRLRDQLAIDERVTDSTVLFDTSILDEMLSSLPVDASTSPADAGDGRLALRLDGDTLRLVEYAAPSNAVPQHERGAEAATYRNPERRTCPLAIVGARMMDDMRSHCRVTRPLPSDDVILCPIGRDTIIAVDRITWCLAWAGTGLNIDRRNAPD